MTFQEQKDSLKQQVAMLQKHVEKFFVDDRMDFIFGNHTVVDVREVQTIIKNIEDVKSSTNDYMTKKPPKSIYTSIITEIKEHKKLVDTKNFLEGWMSFLELILKIIAVDDIISRVRYHKPVPFVKTKNC